MQNKVHFLVEADLQFLGFQANTKMASISIDSFQGWNVKQKYIMGKKWFNVASMD